MGAAAALSAGAEREAMGNSLANLGKRRVQRALRSPLQLAVLLTAIETPECPREHDRHQQAPGSQNEYIGCDGRGTLRRGTQASILLRHLGSPRAR
jgi:hypothetical protein